jgi:hypothetical protein
MAIETSPEIDQLSKALIEFQSKVVTVGRTATNPFFHSKYADLASIMTESQPILTECKICVAQFPDVLGNLPALTTILMHDSGQFVKATILLPVSKITTVTKKEKTTKKPDDVLITAEGYDPQEFGRAITYMRRYGYAAVLQIVIDEDDDGNKSSGKVVERPQENPSNPEVVEKIQSIWKENGGTEEQLDTWVKKNNNNIALDDLPGDRQQAMLTVLEAKKTEREEKAKANLTTVAGESPAESTEPTTHEPTSDNADAPIEQGEKKD